MAVNSDHAQAGHGGWIIYYPGPRIVVTSAYVETESGRYPIRRLSAISVGYVRSYPAGKVALFTGAVELALAAPLAVAYGSVALLAAGLIAAFGLAAALLVDGHRNPSWM